LLIGKPQALVIEDLVAELRRSIEMALKLEVYKNHTFLFQNSNPGNRQ
jgi:hypothetical protein